MHRLLIATLFLAAITASALAADQENGCLVAAFTSYNSANVSLMASGGIPMTVEAQIAQRRLQEQYCVRVAECQNTALPKQQTTMVFDVAFANCLRDEAMEKYELTPSKGN